jgi:ElaB/YqjD/DUF883 family membrane-anchored ribosome-binding protein
MATPNTGFEGTGEKSVTERAKEEASRVAESARQEAGQVFEEAKHQSRELLAEAKDRIKDEARRQAGRTAENIRSVSSELHLMAESSGEPQGTAASWVRMGADEIGSLADRLDREGIEGLVRDVSDFARKRPTAFLAMTFGAGLLAGRLVKNMDTERLKEAGSEAISDSNPESLRQTRPDGPDGSIAAGGAYEPSHSQAGTGI